MGGVSKYRGERAIKKTAGASPNPTGRKTEPTAERPLVLVVESISWDLTQKQESTRGRLLGLNPEAVDKRRGTRGELLNPCSDSNQGPSR